MKHLPKIKHWLLGVSIIVLSLIRFHSGHFLIVWEDIYSVITYGALAPFALSFAEKQKEIAPRSLKITSCILAVLFAAFTAIGRIYYHFYNWGDCFGCAKAVLLLLVQISIYAFAFYPIVLWLFKRLETIKFNGNPKGLDLRKWFWYIIGVKSIFFILFFPCLFDFDAAVGYRTFLDPSSAICDHHPVFIEALHALFFSLGLKLGNPTIGITILSLLFILFSTLVVIYGIKIVERTNISHIWLIAFAACFTFFPFFPSLSLLPTKDGIFAYSFLLYILAVFEIFRSNGRCLNKKYHLIIYSIAALLVCLTRHQGFVIILFNSVALCIYYKTEWRKILRTISSAVLVYILVTKILFPLCNIEPGGKQEMVGTLFQQTAYYLRQYPNDITEQESNAIDAILNINTMADRYKIHVTDPVKNEYKYNPRYTESNADPRKFRHVDHTQEKQELNNYLKAWATMGFRHPSAYFQASGAIALGFFFNSKKALFDIYSEGFYNPAANTKEFQFEKVDYFYQAYHECRKTLTTIPILNWITSIPYYIWASIFFIALICYRKDIQGFIIFLPIILSIGVLLICPVINGRYIFPVVVVLPLLFIYCLLSNRNNKVPTK